MTAFIENHPLRHRVLLACIGLMLAILAFGTLQHTFASQEDKDRATHIIIFKEGVDVDKEMPDVAQAHGLTVKHVYKNAVHGIAANVPPGRLEALRHDPRVAFVEEDFHVSVSAQSIPTGVGRILATTNPNLTINGTDDLRIDADVAVLDTGIDIQHSDLNVVNAVNCMTDACAAGGDDDHYHGTHVAGTIGALDNDFGVVGVAPGARLWAIKVLDLNGDGTISSVIAGLDYVTANADSIEVANLSLACDCTSEAMNQAINNAVNAGVTVVVAAGNSTLDAAAFSPANSPAAITVSALADFNGSAGGGAAATCRTDVDDTLADFSNFGTVVDLVAPGTCIYSTYPIEKGAYASLSGTSMASPHVAGAAALIAASGDFTPAQIKQQFLDTGNYHWTDSAPDGVQEPMLDISNVGVYHPAAVAGSPVVNSAPSVIIKSPANNVTFSATALVNFWATANDPEQGSLSSSIVWTSSLDGQFGTGSSLNRTLSAGTHVITATVTDAQGLVSSASITVTFGSAPATPTPAPAPTINAAVSTSKPLYATGETMTITVSATSNGAALGGAAVSVTITTAKNQTILLSGVTDASGNAVLTWQSAKRDGRGSFTIRTTVTKSGYTGGTASAIVQIK